MAGEKISNKIFEKVYKNKIFCAFSIYMRLTTNGQPKANNITTRVKTTHLGDGGVPRVVKLSPIDTCQYLCGGEHKILIIRTKIL